MTTRVMRRMTESTRAVNAKVKRRQSLSHRRLSVIFANESEGFRKVYEWGLRNKNGTEEVREAMRKRLEDMSVVDEGAEDGFELE
jgi:hypothetical protein